MSKARDIADLGSNDVLETSSTGLDVTGTLTADGLTVDDGEILVRGLNSTVNDNVPTIRFDDTDSSQASGQKAGQILFESSDASPNTNGVYAYINAQATDTSGTGNIYFGTGVTNSAVDRMRIANNGDVSFFEDTGTTAKMVWDASDETLKIGSYLWLNHDGTNADIQSYNVTPLRINKLGNDVLLCEDGGNVGIGTDSPSSIGTNIPTLELGGGVTDRSGGVSFASSDSSQKASAYIAGGAFVLGSVTSQPITFRTNNTERARIDSSGNLRVGNTVTDLSTVGGRMFADGRINAITDSKTCFTARRFNTNGTVVSFLSATSAEVGSIVTSVSATAYNTSSDERLKENIQDTTHVLDINDIKVREFDWKADGEHQRFGFIAQELEMVYPEAVSTDDSEEQMKSVDYSKLVPLLVKEIQQLKADIKELKA